MNRFQNLQNKLQSTVNELNANISDGATRIKQQIQQNVQSSTLLPSSSLLPATDGKTGRPSSSAEDANFIRLPIESAKKLRWYDRQDLGMLIDLHLREKQELYDANEALRNVLVKRGVSKKQIDNEVGDILATVDSLKANDSGVNDVLMLAAKTEIENAHDRIAELSAQIESLQQKSAGTASASDAPTSSAVEDEAESEANKQQGLVRTLEVIATQPASEWSATIDSSLLEAAAKALADLVSLHDAVEEEDQGTDDQPVEPGSATKSSQFVRLRALEEQCSRLEQEIAAAKEAKKLAEESVERKLADAKSRFNSAQQAQQDLLRVAQDKRLEAEARFEAADARAVSSETELGSVKSKMLQLEQDIARLTREASEATAKLAQHEVSMHSERSKNAQQADANAQQALGQYRARINELESSLNSTRQQLAAAQSKASSLEVKLTAADLATAKAMAEIRDLESSVSDRDELALRVSALQAQLDEVRSKQTNAESLRSLASQSEARRAQAEEELVTTAKLAATLEHRLADALSEIQAAKVAADEAESRARSAEAAVTTKVARQWETAGTDRSQWPPSAQSELENVEARLKALNSALAAAEQAAQEAARQRDAAMQQRDEAKSEASVARAAAERLERNSGQREQQLQASAAAATMQVNEFRAALAKVERERDRLMTEKLERDKAADAAAAAVAAARIHAGGGSLHEGASSHPTSRSNSIDSGSIAVKGKSTLGSTDIIYLKNVMLKFIDAYLNGRYQECQVLLPAVAALLQASPTEFRVLKESLENSTGLGWLYTSIAGSSTATNGTVGTSK